jgi:hypothetical protein
MTNPNASFTPLDVLNHMFQPEQTGLVLEYPDIDETFNPKALAAISDWITRDKR